jgi:transcription-repair coupling factor (superfamily II helicase)
MPIERPVASPAAIAAAASTPPQRDPLHPGRFPTSGFETWNALGFSAAVLALARCAAECAHPWFVITESTETADQWVAEWEFFAAGLRLPLLRLPDWETLPFDVFSPHEDILSERLRTLFQLPTLTRGLVVVPVATLMQRLPPRSWLAATCLTLSVGQRLERLRIREFLADAGYQAVQQVQTHGEFAFRGEILDIYPMGLDTPIRIEFLDDEVDSLRAFDPETQRTTQRLERLEVLPGHEFPLNAEAIRDFRNRYRATFTGDVSRHVIYRDVSDGLAPAGIEAYLPLFFDQLDTLFDYCPHAHFIQFGNLQQAAAAFAGEIAQRHEQLRHQAERPLLPPTALYLDLSTLAERLRQRSGLALGPEAAPLPAGRGRRLDFCATALPVSPTPADAQAAVQHLRELLPTARRLLLTAESAGRREALLQLLRTHGMEIQAAQGWDDFLHHTAPLMVAVAQVSEGLHLPGLGMLLPESWWLGDRAPQARRRQRSSRDADAIIQSLSDLTIGAPVVHEENGVGRYLGLETLEVGGQKTEFLALEYADAARLYVPVSSLHLISRYTGADSEHAPLHRLGSEQWARARRKAAEKARDVAAELLEIHARRAARTGTAFQVDTPDYQRFAAAFPFEETPDQTAAITAVLQDMAAPQPMDRVICGDVGFGKTEVAMRATFVAVQNQRQVVVLVPTTLLAQQHHQNFSDRFADWPVRIEVLSRFRNVREQEAVLQGLAQGQVDIVIGTHKLLQAGIQFRDLGLVIVDEEQRFGVRHKEALKKLRAEVDLLTLTATPIPRTLNMTLAGLRDLSLITTPPRARLGIKTFVHEWNDALIQEACLREIRRGGQIYFLHNEVDSIEAMAARLQALLPGARLGVAHGQMRERDLERIMLDFYHRRFSLLVCTTIIETGIDVPTANTIIMHRADRLGLAQMHQLRGRVGRSHHRAYAYLLTPPLKTLTVEARQRLEAIASLEDLGVGFALASHDLEIRGAGELLGAEQSGQITEVGFALYNQLLERAVRALRSGQIPSLDTPRADITEVEMGLPALLPEDYVPDVHTRLILYKRLASVPDPDTLEDLEVELVDRFGTLPPATRTLVAATRIRLGLQALGIRKLEMGAGGARFVFGPEPRIHVPALIGLVQSDPRAFTLDGQRGFRVRQEMGNSEARAVYVLRLIERLQPGLQAA